MPLSPWWTTVLWHWQQPGCETNWCIQRTNNAFAAILTDGSVVTWGDPDCGGNSSKVQEELVGVQQVQATPYAFVAMVDNGFAVTWGDLNTCCGIDSSQLQEQLVAVRALSIAPSHCRAVSQKEHRPRMAQLVQVQKIQATMAAFAAILGDGSVVTCPRRKQQRSALQSRQPEGASPHSAAKVTGATLGCRGIRLRFSGPVPKYRNTSSMKAPVLKLTEVQL